MEAHVVPSGALSVKTKAEIFPLFHCSADNNSLATQVSLLRLQCVCVCVTLQNHLPHFSFSQNRSYLLPLVTITSYYNVFIVVLMTIFFVFLCRLVGLPTHQINNRKHFLHQLGNNVYFTPL